MINIQAQTCDEAWRKAAELVRANGLAQESRTFRSEVTTETLELLHTSMTIENPRDRLVFSRPINPAFAIAEVIWILAGSNDLAFIRFWNETMRNFSDNGVTLNGAYGYRLGSFSYGDLDSKLRHIDAKRPPTFDQLRAARHTLLNTPHSRQVVLQIWDVNQDFPIAGEPNSKDIPCNVISHLLVRDGKLHWLQIMRSNDLMWGTPYNFVQWTSLQEIMAGWLGLEVGQYTHVASSLHVYQNHWEELKASQLDTAVMRADADLRIKDYGEWAKVFGIVLRAAYELTQVHHHSTVYAIVQEACNNIPNAYAEWVYLLGAEVCRKLGNVHNAEHLITSAGKYYQASWLRWFERKQLEMTK